MEHQQHMNDDHFARGLMGQGMRGATTQMETAVELSRQARDRARAVGDVPCPEGLRAWVKSNWQAKNYATIGS